MKKDMLPPGNDILPLTLTDRPTDWQTDRLPPLGSMYVDDYDLLVLLAVAWSTSKHPVI